MKKKQSTRTLSPCGGPHLHAEAGLGAGEGQHLDLDLLALGDHVRHVGDAPFFTELRDVHQAFPTLPAKRCAHCYPLCWPTWTPPINAGPKATANLAHFPPTTSHYLYYIKGDLCRRPKLSRQRDRKDAPTCSSAPCLPTSSLIEKGSHFTHHRLTTEISYVNQSGTRNPDWSLGEVVVGQTKLGHWEPGASNRTDPSALHSLQAKSWFHVEAMQGDASTQS